LTISVYESEQLSLDQIQEFLKASEGIRFEGKTQQQIYGWVEKVLVQPPIPEARSAGAGSAAALPGEDDGAEPGPRDAAD
jgi:hypothetical protein